MHAPDSAGGKKGRCKGCGAVLQIPGTEMVGADTILGDPQGVARSSVSPMSSAPPPLPYADTIQDEANDDTEVEETDLAPLLSRVSSRTLSPSQRKAAAPSGSPAASGSVPPEPWYYERLITVANFWHSLGNIVLYGGIGIGCLVVVLGIMRATEGRESSLDFAIPTLLTGVGIAFGAAVNGTLMLIIGLSLYVAVDAARNVRALRYRA